MVLRPNVDLRRDIKAVRGTVRYEMLSGHLNGTGLPASTRGNGAFVGIDADQQGIFSCRKNPTTLAKRVSYRVWPEGR